jgi:hypothetical protein
MAREVTGLRTSERPLQVLAHHRPAGADHGGLEAVDGRPADQVADRAAQRDERRVERLAAVHGHFTEALGLRLGDGDPVRLAEPLTVADQGTHEPEGRKVDATTPAAFDLRLLDLQYGESVALRNSNDHGREVDGVRQAGHEEQK